MQFIKMTAYDARAKIPETVIDNFVDRVVFDHGDFIWYLNPTFGNEVYSQTTSDWKKNNCRPLQVIQKIHHMPAAAQGANTHKGLIFSLGILCSGAAILFKDRSVRLTEEGLFAMEQRMVSVPLRQELERLCRNGAQKAEKRTHGEQKLKELDARFIRENISPGGSADLLAVTIFVTRLLSEYTVFSLAAAQGEEKLN